MNRTVSLIESSFGPLRYRRRRCVQPSTSEMIFSSVMGGGFHPASVGQIFRSTCRNWSLYISFIKLLSYFFSTKEKRKKLMLCSSKHVSSGIAQFFQKTKWTPNVSLRAVAHCVVLKKKHKLSTNLNVSLSLYPTHRPRWRSLGSRSCWLVAEGCMRLYIYTHTQETHPKIQAALEKWWWVQGWRASGGEGERTIG